MTERWYTVHINPEPWAIGTAYRGGISPNPNLVSYQKAIREQLEGADMLPSSHRKLTFYFFRQVEKYIDTADRRRTRNIADVTNCQKALEDALQGILIPNDREVTDIRSVMVMQSTEVEHGFTLIKAEYVPGLPGLEEIPQDIIQAAISSTGKTIQSTRWQDADQLF